MQAELQRQLEATMLATIAQTEKQVRVASALPPGAYICPNTLFDLGCSL